ncbi:acyl-CoA thioesterase [Brevibacterium album]|uniref:acyl-CoA thioesterase n=1 Tax=Brevibacterium album TaxID=417948 RepID=UPI000416D4C6|nr:acyl-CoA thioesterase domain-containing protein [Brevibacterium album]
MKTGENAHRAHGAADDADATAESTENIAALRRVLDLEPLSAPGVGGEEHSFLGWNQPKPGGRLFGGQVLAQCVMATSATVAEDRPIHSFHGYFLRAGAVDKELTFGVDVLRDGRSFSARRVQAYQDGQPIFTGMASFQDSQEGASHQDAMPEDIPGPEELANLAQQLSGHQHPHLEGWVFKRPFEIRPVEPAIQAEFRGEQVALSRFWVRPISPFRGDRVSSAAAVAYASDYSLLEPTLRRHGVPWYTPGLRMASLDHAMWWHAPIDVDDWLLFDFSAPRSGGGRALGAGRVFSRDGVLVANVAQQGMVRIPG